MNRYGEDQHLRLKLQFSNHDLQENRAGRLSETQKRWIIREANKLRALYWMYFLRKRILSAEMLSS